MPSDLKSLLKYRVRVTLVDKRELVGELLSYDQHMNLILADCQEFRQLKGKKRGMDKRTLGLTILRGGNVICVVEESGPVPKFSGGSVRTSALSRE